MAHIYRKQILEQYLDSYGHVNNSSYLILLEEARWDLVESKGCGYEYVQKTQKGPVVLEVNLRFVKELRLREWVTIETQLLNYSGKIGELEQYIKKQDGELATTAFIKFGLFDLQKRKLIEPDENWKRAFI
jgi:acyl-CoA thioester hydrolase